VLAHRAALLVVWQKCEMAYTQVACVRHLQAVAPIISDRNGSGHVSLAGVERPAAAGGTPAHATCLSVQASQATRFT